MMVSASSPNGSFSGEGNNAADDSNGNSGMSPRSGQGLMYADLQFPKSVNSGSLMTAAKLGRISSSLLMEGEGSATGAANSSHYSRARERADI